MPGALQDFATFPIDWLVILPVALALRGAGLLLMLRDARRSAVLAGAGYRRGDLRSTTRCSSLA